MDEKPDEEEKQDYWIRWLPGALKRRVENSPTLQKIIQNAGWLVSERVGIMAIRFFVGVWVVRYLGPDNYGVYSYAVSLAALSKPISSLGLNQVVIRECSRDKYPNDLVLSTAFWMRGIAAVVVVSIIAVMIYSIEDDWITKLVVLIISGQILFDTLLVSDQWFQSQLQSKYSVYARTVAVVVSSALKIIAVVAGSSVVVFAIILLVQSAIQATGFGIALRSLGPQFSQFSPSVSIASKLFKNSWPLMIAAFSTMIYMKIDQVMMKNMVGENEVGVYASAVKVSELWYFLPTAIASSVFPEVVRSREKLSYKEYMGKIQTFYDSMAALAYAVTIPVTFLAPYIVLFLFGEAYSDAGPILQIHVWSFIFIALGVARGKWLVAENLVKHAMFATLIGALSNIGLNFFLIPRAGAEGAAWATLISYVLYSYVSLLVSTDTRIAFKQLSKAIVLPFRFNSFNN